MVSAFEGNKAETKTMLPVIKGAAGLSFILGMKIPFVPYVIAQ